MCYWMAYLPAYSSLCGLCMQVVFMQRCMCITGWPICQCTAVAVVLVCRWSLCRGACVLLDGLSASVQQSLWSLYAGGLYAEVHVCYWIAYLPAWWWSSRQVSLHHSNQLALLGDTKEQSDPVYMDSIPFISLRHFAIESILTCGSVLG